MSFIKESCNNFIEHITRLDASNDEFGTTLTEHLKGRARDITIGKVKVAVGLLFAVIAIAMMAIGSLAIGAGCFLVGLFVLGIAIRVKEIIIQIKARDRELTERKVEDKRDIQFTVNDLIDEIKQEITAIYHEMRYGELEQPNLLRKG